MQFDVTNRFTGAVLFTATIDQRTDICDMPYEAVIRVLDQIVFTSARDYRRSVLMDRGARDMIVSALRAAARERTAAGE